MELGLRGKGVVVTGAASNIGRAIALAFAREGAKVAVVDIDREAGERTSWQAESLGAEAATFLLCDVTDREQVAAMAEEVGQRFGAIDVLVNNVGWDRPRLFVEEPWEDMERKVRLNLWSVLTCSRIVLPGMVERRAGSVVNIASDAGRVGEFREAVYSACKGGVIALTKALARECGRYGVRVNCVCPGTTMPSTPEDAGAYSMWRAGEELASWTTEEMRERIARAYPLRRLGTADEVARAVVFLASEAASFITGQTLSVSGGYSMI